MRSDDAVETFKRHADNEVGAALNCSVQSSGGDPAVPQLVGRNVNVVPGINVPENG